MKTLLKILRRYVVAAFCIACSVLFLNFVFYAWLVLNYDSGNDPQNRATQIVDHFTSSNGAVFLQDADGTLLDGWVWGMLLDDSGTVIWEKDLPTEFPLSYTAGDIAGFSRWYLKDYPVTVYRTEYGLLVLGAPQGSVWKHDMSMPMSVMDHAIEYSGAFLMVNIVFILTLCMLFGLRFYRALCPVATGIDGLAKQEPLDLSEKGIAENLTRKLNETSRILAENKMLITRRDNARMGWIAGVSHDIRTPLSLIMGYAETLSDDSTLSEEQRHLAAIIQNQSIKIKQLIEDLNLTSKLEHTAQPLRLSVCAPATLLRTLVADACNSTMDATFELTLTVSHKSETARINCDKLLFVRAFENLIRNSLRHSGGSSIRIDVTVKEERLWIEFADNGCGFPPNVLVILKGQAQHSENEPHIMGLHLVQQIVKMHNGEIVFLNAASGGARIYISLPVIL